MIAAVIFSRDRACQLDLLLSSLKRNGYGLFDPCTVIWKATDEHFQHGYKVCASEHPHVRFQKEYGITYQVRAAVRKPEFVTFFTDDDILYRSLDSQPLWALERSEVLCFSLRLGLNTTICYPHARKQQIPHFVETTDDVIMWDWAQADGDFSYPCSLDGHIFRGEDLAPAIQRRNFQNPNWLEDVLMSVAREIGRPLMASYAQSRLFGVPANRVNETHANRFGTTHRYEAKELNERYLAGERIRGSSENTNPIIGAHQELEYTFSNDYGLVGTQ